MLSRVSTFNLWGGRMKRLIILAALVVAAVAVVAPAYGSRTRRAEESVVHDVDACGVRRDETKAERRSPRDQHEEVLDPRASTMSINTPVASPAR